MWDFYRCEACGSGYYNPRPTPETVGRLYEAYYTHAHTDAPDYAQLSLLGKLRRILGNGYRNYRFGMREQPASMLGVLAAWLMPDYRALLDAGGRHLPKQPKGRLLDVGCGNGDFLLFAQRAGWEAIGVEPDPKAVEVARARRLTVYLGGLETLGAESEAFDGITQNHVIERVHDPCATLAHCYRLLKSGGWLWLETPNLDAQGQAHDGENWVGLDILRHLVVFTDRALLRLLREVGFARVERLPYYPLCARVFAMSRAIATSASPHHPPPLPRLERFLARQAETTARRFPEHREFIYARGRHDPADVWIKPPKHAADNRSMQITSLKPVALSPANALQQTANQAQVSLARKVLDVQKQQAATLLKQLDGVGQRLDVRV